jgi:hypothetical protein
MAIHALKMKKVEWRLGENVAKGDFEKYAERFKSSSEIYRQAAQNMNRSNNMIAMITCAVVFPDRAIFQINFPVVIAIGVKIILGKSSRATRVG